MSQSHIASLAESDRNDARPRAECAERHREKERHDPVQTAGNDQHNQKGARCAEFLAKRCVIRNSKAPPLSPREKPTWLCESKLQHSCGTDVDAFCGTDVDAIVGQTSTQSWDRRRRNRGTNVDAIFCGTDVDAILLLAGAKLPLGESVIRVEA